MRHHPGTLLVALVSAAVMIPVLGITLLFLSEIGGHVLAQVAAVVGSGIAGTSVDTIETGAGFAGFATLGMLSIPASIVLALLLRGWSSDSPDVQRRGPL